MTNTETEYEISRSVILGRTYFLLTSPDELIGKFSSHKAAFNFIKILNK